MGEATTGSASVEIAADAASIWNLVTNVRRMGEWSPETYAAEWLSEEPRVGAIFRGSNRLGGFEWSSECEVLELVSGETFSFRVLRVIDANGSRDIPLEETTTWRYDIDQLETGVVRLTESFDCPGLAVPGSPPAQIPGRRQMLADGCARTVASIKAALEAPS